jgi:tripartite-type tricarboxylate transporter receptor subunit TctC
MKILKILLLCSIVLATPAGAQSWPNKAVRVIVPFPAGGSADVLARIVSEKMSLKWGQPVIVDNRAGAGGNIGADAVYRADPDGYTILSSPPGPLSINLNLYDKLSYDPLKFVPVTVLAIVPNVVTARLDFPASSLKELIVYAKANPGKVIYASQGNGSTSHLSASMLATMAGLELVHVPYKGEGPALVDVSAGRVDIFIGNIAAALRLQQAGRVKFLGLTHPKRSAVAPDVPTTAEFGMPDFVASAWFAMVLPPGTPAAIAQQVHAAAAEALRLPDVREKFLAQGAEPVGQPPAETAAFIKEEMGRWQKVIKAANVTLAN